MGIAMTVCLSVKANLHCQLSCYTESTVDSQKVLPLLQCGCVSRCFFSLGVFVLHAIIPGTKQNQELSNQLSNMLKYGPPPVSSSLPTSTQSNGQQRMTELFTQYIRKS